MPVRARLLESVQKVTQTKGFRAIGPAVIPRVDKLVHRLSKGRFTMSSAGVPTVVLTAIGAKSGQPRTTPLATVRRDGSFYVVGSNFGRQAHPAWTANLLAHPQASVSFRGATFDVRAHLLDEQERAREWPLLLQKWPAWQDYEDRVDRELRVFRLTPTA